MGTPRKGRALDLLLDQFRFLSVVRQGENTKFTKKANGISGEVEKSGGGSRISKREGGIKFGKGFGIWTWVLVQERFGRRFTDARAEPESVEEMGKGAWIPLKGKDNYQMHGFEMAVNPPNLYALINHTFTSRMEGSRSRWR